MRLSDAITPHGGKYVQTCRISRINEICEYRKFARFFVHRLMVRVDGVKGKTTGWYKFKHDQDRKALNREAGWSDAKDIYYLENPTLN